MRPNGTAGPSAGQTHAALAPLPEQPMETFATIVRYGFLAALAIEAVLIVRALIGLLREKARAASPAPAAEE